MPLLETRDAGLYCPAGDFFIDPATLVDRAIITHAHSGHAAPGSHGYLTARTGDALLRARLGPDANIQPLPYGERLTIGDVAVSLHPAGHIRGSAQVRLEHAGEVWVVSGDYKLTPDPTCEPFEPVRCHTFVTASKFALPIFRWPDPAVVISAIESWWRGNRDAGKASLLFANPLGKAQHVLASLDTAIGPLIYHDSVERYNAIYRGEGVTIPAASPQPDHAQALIVAPPDSHNTPWAKRFGVASTALVSGWMRIRGTRRRRSLDRGFVMSGHADWPGVLAAIDASQAESVWATHGFSGPLVHWLQEHGRRALAIDTPLAHAESQSAAEPGSEA